MHDSRHFYYPLPNNSPGLALTFEARNNKIQYSHQLHIIEHAADGWMSQQT